MSRRRAGTSLGLDPSWSEMRIDEVMLRSERLAARRLRLKPRDQQFPPLNNTPDAFSSPLPGYQGYCPLPTGALKRRCVVVDPSCSQDMYSTYTKSWRPPVTIGGEERKGRLRDHAVDYRSQCHRYTHKCSPFVKDLTAPPELRKFDMAIIKSQFGF